MLKLSDRMAHLGTETAFEVLARAEELARGGRDVINLGIGQPDFKTPPHVVEAAVKALRDGHHGYTPAPGIPALREAVAADIATRRGVEVDPARIVVVPGGKVTMFFAILMFGEPGTEDHVPQPRLSHLRVGHQVERGEGGPDPSPREPGLLLRRGGGARERHPPRPASSSSTRRPTPPAGRSRSARSTSSRRASRSIRTWPC